jgi:anti-sigma regulatory factor (Ser/Thr protein kinase)
VECFELQIPSDPRFAKIVRCCIHHIAQLSNLPDLACQRLTLATDEAFSNIIKHAYQLKTDQAVKIKCYLDAQKIEIIFYDNGRPEEPENIKPRKLNEIRAGGLGIHFIRSIMDEVDYQATPKGNVLTLIKYISEENSGNASN